MKKIKSIPKINKLILLVLLFLNATIIYSQSKNPINSGFRISLSEGVTFNLDKNIHVRGKTLDVRESNFNIDLTNFEIGYYISNHNEIGLSIGKNSFTYPEDFTRGSSVSNDDTTYFIENGYKYVNMTWLALYYNYHFQNSFKAGLKLGGLSPTFPENDYQMYLNLSIGKFYKITDNFLIDITISFTNRNNDFKYFKSNQLNLTLGLNLKI
ncbi:MAG: hypothetical protein IPH77_12750 [Ignavibacteria bacterium]|nr:hypothetical protein [Ignavibacteria bacterium]MBK7159387.1 hypothetical protein [Ignavibacteria bacterium]